jgi:NAD(P)H-nitrite reductase large subunit
MNLTINQTLRDLSAKLCKHQGSHKFTEQEKIELNQFWLDSGTNRKNITWGCGSCVNTALKVLYNYINFHETKQAMQTQPSVIDLHSMDRSMLIELATVKGLEFPKNIKTTKLIELLKQ